MRTAPPVRIAQPVTIRTAVPVFASAPPVRKEEPLPVRKVNIQTAVRPAVEVEETRILSVQEKEESSPVLPDTLEIGEEGNAKTISEKEKTASKDSKGEPERAIEGLEKLKI